MSKPNAILLASHKKSTIKSDMHIFNLNTRPHLILTHKELLFRHDHSDEQMQRHLFEEIEHISIQHQYDDRKNVLFFLIIKLTTKQDPVLLPLNALDLPLEELLGILSQELDKKIRLSLPSAKWIQRIQNRSGRKRLWLSALVIFGIALYPLHKMFIPSLAAINEHALNSVYTQTLGLCSANAKAALPSAHENMIDIHYYCGILGLWKESSQKTIEKRYLEAEFSSLDANSYLIQAETSFDSNQSSEALTPIANALYLDPTNPQAYLLLSQIQNSLGFTNPAIESLQKASSLDPESSAIALALSSLYLQENNFKEAYVYAKKATLIETNAANLVTVAKIESLLGMTDQAIKHYELSLQEDPDNLEVLSALSLYYRKQQNLPRLAEKLEKIYRLAPDEPLNFLNYYEISLIIPVTIDAQEREAFVEKYKDSKKTMMIYDMLQSIRLCIENKETQDALDLWSAKYENEKLVWSFQTLRGWLDESQLDIEHIQYIQTAIGFFIGYQRAYNLNHNEGSL